MLKVSALQAAYGASQVLFDVGFEIAEGEVVTLLGRNGMGKTTTVRAIMGLLPPMAGEVQIDGRSVFGAAPPRGRAGA
jgi:branched-chain amino acid transport system ATP-binding protein